MGSGGLAAGFPRAWDIVTRGIQEAAETFGMGRETHRVLAHQTRGAAGSRAFSAAMMAR